MAQQLSNYLEASKTDYIGGIQEVLNNKQKLWGMIQKVQADGSGTLIDAATGPYPSGTMPPRTVNFDVHLGRAANGGFQNSEHPFATAANERYKQGLIQARTLYWPARVSIATVRRTRTNAVAFATALSEAAVRTANSILDSNERVLLGDGSGVLGVAAAGAITWTAGVATVTLDNYHDLRKFAIGQYVQGLSSRTSAGVVRTFTTAGTNIIAQVTAVSLSGSTATIQLTQTGGNGTQGTFVAGDVLVKALDTNSANNYGGARSGAAAAGASTVRHEPMGLHGISLDCDTPMETGATAAGLYGINATTQYAAPSTATPGASVAGGELAWQAYNSRSATGRSVNNAIMESLRVVPNTNMGEMPDLYVTSWGGEFEYANTLLGIRRNVNTTSLQGATGGGYNLNGDATQVPEYGGLAVIPSRYAPTYPVGGQLCTSMMAFNLNYLKIHEWHPLRYIDDDGQTWRMVPASGGGFSPFIEAIMEHTWEVVTTCRNSHSAAHAILASDFT